jgi:sulfonate transport system substrate-binding protein
MKIYQAKLGYSVYVFAIGFLLFALATLADTADLGGYPKEFHVGYQKYSVLLLLKSRGTLEKRLAPLGISVKWSEFAFGPPMLEALNAGSIDYAATGETPPVFAQAARNAQLVYVGQEPASPASEAILVPANSNIHTLAELKGKKIAVAKGSNAHYLLISALAKAGLAWKDVQPVYLLPADAYAAFQRGAVDAWSIWDFYRAAAETRLNARLLADGTGLAGNFDNYTSRRDFAGQYPKLIAVVLDEIAQTDAWASANPELAAAVIAPAVGLEPEIVTSALKRRRYGAGPLTAAFLDSQQQIADTLAELGLIPHKIQVREATLGPRLAQSAR